MGTATTTECSWLVVGREVSPLLEIPALASLVFDDMLRGKRWSAIDKIGTRVGDCDFVFGGSCAAVSIDFLLCHNKKYLVLVTEVGNNCPKVENFER